MFPNKNYWNYSFLLAMILPVFSFAQSDKYVLTDNNIHKDDIVMTWKKNTPEQEMKDDCKALSEKGITIKYSDIKRNSKEEITGIRVEYSDRKGNKGNLEYDNQKPIGTITFYKNGEEVGFGEPNNSNGIASNDFMNGFSNPQELLKQFQLGNDKDNSQSFSFSFPKDGESFGQSKSRIQIQKDGKKPLVIEDGKVIEGGEDYSPEELDKIKSENKVEHFGFSNEDGNSNEFDFRNQEGLDNFKKEMNKLMPNSLDKSKSEMDSTKEEMLKAKEEMIKAKDELEKARKELEKSKVKVKTQKA
ncbi:coiled-coil domain-containing protein [Flavobacterium sp.]|jgi:hypothetical protein|uniref:coiled-coil domain-containing protein n=1 Tax=Flavobacterium sp. TaxID=239 RepID=UPI0037C14A4E